MKNKEIKIRLDRLEGQLKEIVAMVDSGQEVMDIIQHIMFVKRSLSKLAVKLLITGCAKNALDIQVENVFIEKIKVT